MWTVQELVFSSEASIICGGKEIVFTKIVYFRTMWEVVKIYCEIVGTVGQYPPRKSTLAYPPALTVAGSHETELLELLDRPAR